MYSIKNSISTPEYNADQIYKLVNDSIPHLIDLLSLTMAKATSDSETRTVHITGKKFEGQISCSDQKIELQMCFKGLLSFNKKLSQKKVDHWIQELLSSTVDM